MKSFKTYLKEAKEYPDVIWIKDRILGGNETYESIYVHLGDGGFAETYSKEQDEYNPTKPPEWIKFDHPTRPTEYESLHDDMAEFVGYKEMTKGEFEEFAMTEML